MYTFLLLFHAKETCVQVFHAKETYVQVFHAKVTYVQVFHAKVTYLTGLARNTFEMRHSGMKLVHWATLGVILMSLNLPCQSVVCAIFI